MRNNPEKNQNEGSEASIWHFGNYVLDRGSREIRCNHEPVHLSKRPFDVLEYLIAERSRLVSRAELLAKFWGAGEVYEEALTRCVSSIRKALGDTRDPPRFLETRWAEGYHFIGEVSVGSVAADPKVPLISATGWRWTRAQRFGFAAVAILLLAASVAGYWRQRDMRALERQPILRLAMLPVTAIGEERWLAEGMTDELIQSLSHIEGLTVISRGSVSEFGASPDPRAVARELGVQAVLATSLRRNGGASVLSARLLSAQDGAVLWAFDKEESQADLARSRTSIAVGLARHLSARLRAAPARLPRDPEAYRQYLRGRSQWNLRTAASISEAIRLFEQSSAREPEFADAKVGLAESWLLMPLYAGSAPYDAHPKARAAAETALKLDPESARAEAVLGVVASQYEWNWTESDRHFLRAIALDANLATAYQWWAESLCYRSRFAECELNMREARALDPLSPVLAVVSGVPARFAGDYALARTRVAAAQEAHPNFAFAEYQLGLIASAEGKWTEAIERLERAMPFMGPILGGAPLAFAYAKAGRKADALRIRGDLEALSAHAYVPPVAFGDIAMGFGDHELALVWLGRAAIVHDDFLVGINVDHHYRDLRRDQRFQALLKRIGIEAAQ